MSDLIEAEELQKKLKHAVGDERAALKEELNKIILTKRKLWLEDKEHEQRRIKIITGEE